MGAAYMIAGRKVLPEYLAIATLTSSLAAVYAFTGGKKPAEAVPTPGPEVPPGSQDGHIRDYLIQKEREEAKQAQH